MRNVRRKRVESFSRHIEDGIPGRDTPSERHPTGPDSARDVKVPFPLRDQAITPAKGCLACVRDIADTRDPNLAAVRVPSERQMWSGRYVRKPGRIMS